MPMLMSGIFILMAASLVFGFGLGSQPSTGKRKRWWRSRMIVGGLAGMLLGLVLMIIGIFNLAYS